MNKDITDALCSIGRAIDKLGNADAATPMGGLEALGSVQKEGFKIIADAISEGLDGIALAIDRIPVGK